MADNPTEKDEKCVECGSKYDLTFEPKSEFGEPYKSWVCEICFGDLEDSKDPSIPHCKGR